MLPRNHPDRIRVSFDDHRLVANAGLLLPATLAQHLGLPELVQQCLDLVLQRRFLDWVSFWTEIASRKARLQGCQRRGQVAMKSVQDPFIAKRRCNTRTRAGKP